MAEEPAESRASEPPLLPAGTAAKGFMAALMSSEITAYAVLLVASVVTITGSMYVLSSREDSRTLMQIAAFRGAALSSENRADFRSDSGIRSVVIQFEDGVVTQLKDRITTLAGGITAVSTRLVDEVRAEDAARAAALAASRNPFSQSEAAALAAQAQVVTVPGVAPPAPPPPPTTAPATATSAPPPATNAPLQGVPTNVPPANTPAPPPPPQNTAAAQAPPLQPSATPLPPSPTSTPRPEEDTAPAPARPAEAVPAAPVAPVAPVVAPISGAATSVAEIATSVAATAVPTRVLGLTPTAFPTPDATATPVPILFGINANGGEGGYAQAIFPSSFTFEPGITRSQTLTLANSGFDDFSYSLRLAVPTVSPQTSLWTDATNGLQIGITRDGTSIYSGPLKNLDKLAALDGLDMGFIAKQTAQNVSLAITLPVTAPDAYQGLTQNVNIIFDIVTPPYGNAPTR